LKKFFWVNNRRLSPSGTTAAGMVKADCLPVTQSATGARVVIRQFIMQETNLIRKTDLFRFFKAWY